ncbi:MAG: 4Fe-4S binding protein [Candidatus Altiarchaeales archaeon]|nr:4Fe-4S binding protein [Candidatus Altiarchaeota archaeon]MBU4342226.1 4Fe-4S binding protein [Candidatus Altiarchaeota archaeon]MBU4406124.1 4Fe-4S binding protein [Candidatus Altiarchaeota archaeon]MBU4437665.1 4Fe-4S binding protein [Candidatus Altiarchaeota archaeon]MCG2782895.1 4Fe-4S binding protein [Candidatus Altiarchaeales archaeon]
MDEEKEKPKKENNRVTQKKLRKASQVLVLILVMVLTYLVYSVAFSVCWLDPMWHLQALFANRFDMGTDTYFMEGLTRIFVPSVLILGAFVLLAILFGRIFCGWFCPFGTMLDYIEGISPFRGKLHLPRELKDPGIKYAILIGFLILSFMTSQEAFCEFCPAGTVLKGLTGHIIFLSIPVFIVTLFIVLFYGRKTWCSYLCPLGAFFALFTRFHLFGIRAKKEDCTKCFMCNKACPMDVLVVEKYIQEGKKINDPECIKCMDCVDACPIKILKFP